MVEKIQVQTILNTEETWFSNAVGLCMHAKKKQKKDRLEWSQKNAQKQKQKETGFQPVHLF